MIDLASSKKLDAGAINRNKIQVSTAIHLSEIDYKNSP